MIVDQKFDYDSHYKQQAAAYVRAQKKTRSKQWYGSCQNKCGGRSRRLPPNRPPRGLGVGRVWRTDYCYCDAVCPQQGDCCDDYHSQCGWDLERVTRFNVELLASVVTFGTVSVGGTFGSSAATPAKTNLVALPAGHKLLSCAGACSEGFVSQGDKVCFCDDQCEGAGDCCHDRLLYCPGPPTVDGAIEGN